jgi:phage terminase large subunit-like protein
MPTAARTAYADEVLEGLPAEECERLYKATRYNWEYWARPQQLAPTEPFDILGLVGGRGSGKTRPGSEWARWLAAKYPGARMALVGRTARDTRDTMVLGESGILAVSPPWFRPRYFPSRSLVRWPNGFQAHLYSADEPDLLRGPQHHFGWADEFATFAKPEAWTNLLDGLRLGEHPSVLLTTTPRRTPLFLDTFLGKSDGRSRPVPAQATHGKDEWEFTVTTKDHLGNEVKLRTVVRRYRTEQNALFLAAGFAAKRRVAYGDSSYGRMELDAEIMEIVEGALWNLKQIDDLRVQQLPRLIRRVVIVDPSHSSDGRYDAAGIIVLGLGAAPDGSTGALHVYVLDDRTVQGSPNAWGKAAEKAYIEHQADLIIYEMNASPGKPDVVPDVMKTIARQGTIRCLGVYASKDKRTRAEPVSSLYEAKRVHHFQDAEDAAGRVAQHLPVRLAQLEQEMVSWDPWDPKAKSPNRVDALVHGVTFLLLQGGHGQVAAPESAGTRPNPWRIDG